MSYGIHYATGCAFDLICFTDSYWAGDGVGILREGVNQ
jgi:hypothetical protein